MELQGCLFAGVDVLLLLLPAVATNLRNQLGEVQAELAAKERERDLAAQDRDRMAKELADQAATHKAQLGKLSDAEMLLRAEFETERSNWAEKEPALQDSYGAIAVMVDGKPPALLSCACRLSRPAFFFLILCLVLGAEFFPGHSVAAGQAIEAQCNERHRAGR